MCPAPKFTAEEQMDLIMSAAQVCIKRRSLAEFTMSELSKEAGISMGSIYKQIQSKEDVFLALSIDMLQEMGDTFKKVFALDLPAPAKIAALTLISSEKIFCFEFGKALEGLVSNSAMLSKASQSWIDRYVQADEDVEVIVADFIHQAVVEGMPEMSEQQLSDTVEQLLLGSWSMHVGFLHVGRQRHARNASGRNIELPVALPAEHPIVQAMMYFLNGYPWHQKVVHEDLLLAIEKLAELDLR